MNDLEKVRELILRQLHIMGKVLYDEVGDPILDEVLSLSNEVGEGLSVYMNSKIKHMFNVNDTVRFTGPTPGDSRIYPASTIGIVIPSLKSLPIGFHLVKVVRSGEELTVHGGDIKKIDPNADLDIGVNIRLLVEVELAGYNSAEAGTVATIFDVTDKGYEIFIPLKYSIGGDKVDVLRSSFELI